MSGFPRQFSMLVASLFIALIGVFGSEAASAQTVPTHSPPIVVSGYGGIHVKVWNVHYSLSRVSGLVVFGEVKNVGAKPISDPAVLISIYNRQHQRLARGVDMTMAPNVLLPHQATVWRAYMSDSPKPSWWAKIAIEVGQQIGAAQVAQQNDPYVKVLSYKVKAANPGYSEEVVGRVVNRGGKVARQSTGGRDL